MAEVMNTAHSIFPFFLTSMIKVFMPVLMSYSLNSFHKISKDSSLPTRRTMSLSSRLQAIPLFEAYRLGTSILGMIRTVVEHHYKSEFVL